MCRQYDPEQHKTCKIHGQNTQILLDYKLEYEIGVDLHRESGIINVMSAFFA